MRRCIDIVAVLFVAIAAGCGRTDTPLELNVPRGYVATLQIDRGGSRLGFGPFVGYYFRPETGTEFDRLQFVCFNEGGFYASDAPENAKLFEGTAVFTELPDVGFEIPDHARINPVFFSDAPPEWLASRPDPASEFLHFHSCHSDAGFVRAGYWFRHVAVTNFTYDMGGRVGRTSPMYHQVQMGVDMDFPQIIEFDNGP